MHSLYNTLVSKAKALLELNPAKYVLLCTAAMGLAACANSAEPMVGGDRDAHGCIGSAGMSWSAVKQECVQPWEVADMRAEDAAHPNSAVYVILSEDKSQAEIFAVDVASNTFLEAVKGGYASRDGALRLEERGGKWLLLRTATR